MWRRTLLFLSFFLVFNPIIHDKYVPRTKGFWSLNIFANAIVFIRRNWCELFSSEFFWNNKIQHSLTTEYATFIILWPRQKKMLLRTGKISYPHSVDDVLFRTLSGITFFFLCGTQDEFLNVSVAFNIWEPYLMSLLDLYKSTSWGFSQRRVRYFALGKKEAWILVKEGVVKLKALN